MLTGLGNRALSGIPLVAVAYAMEPAKAVVAHRACGLSMAFEGKNNIDQYKTADRNEEHGYHLPVQIVAISRSIANATEDQFMRHRKSGRLLSLRPSFPTSARPA